MINLQLPSWFYKPILKGKGKGIPKREIKQYVYEFHSDQVYKKITVNFRNMFTYQYL